MLNIINSKMDKLRDELDKRRKRNLKRDDDLTISRKKRNRRFIESTRRIQVVEREGRPEKQQLRKAKWRILKISVILS